MDSTVNQVLQGATLSELGERNNLSRLHQSYFALRFVGGLSKKQVKSTVAESLRRFAEHHQALEVNCRSIWL